MRLRKSVCLAMIAALLVPSAPAAADHPYGADPLGLVPFIDTTQQVYSTGTDVWEVWTCQVPGWTPVVSLAQVVDDLNTEISPYFRWLSGGRYAPTFVTGGAVQGADEIPTEFDSPEPLFAPDCQQAVSQASGGGSNGALIVVDAGFDEGYALSGGICPEAPFTGCTTTYPSNGRSIVVGAATVATVDPFPGPQWITVAHEVGHALNWPHSYGGLTFDPLTGLVDRYDNPMDVMSGAIHSGDPIGTIAYYRYAAGWIDPDDVIVHSGELGIYDLAVTGNPGPQMIVIPSDEPGRFFTLGTRRRSSYDADLPRSGVEVYEIDQRRDIACALPADWPETWPCFATLQRVKQTPAIEGLAGTEHVLSIDDAVVAGRFTVTVVGADVDSFSVRVSENDSGTFIDDDGNPFEPDIEKIADAAITKGCNPPVNDRFCPAGVVTRAEMAAFLIRAMNLENSVGPHQGLFPDVAAGAWYAPYVERLFELGVTTGYTDGTYRPDATVTRAEMAAFLVRAFDNPTSLGSPQGLFADVPDDAWYVREAERLFGLGITLGCSSQPLSYCPNDTVKRDQMAAFLARALGL